MGKIILTASGKGGVGKSVFTLNIGAVLAARGRKVVMTDMNIGLRNLDIYLGLEDRVIFDVADVIAGVCAPKKAWVRDRRFPCLCLIAATQRREKFSAGAAEVAAFYAELARHFDFVLADGPGGVNDDLRLAASGVDAAVLVTTLEHVSLRDADMADKLLADTGVRARGYVINKVNRNLLRSGALPTLDQVSSVLKTTPVGIIQEDENIRLAANCGIPIVCQRGNYIEENFAQIAERLTAL